MDLCVTQKHNQERSFLSLLSHYFEKALGQFSFSRQTGQIGPWGVTTFPQCGQTFMMPLMILSLVALFAFVTTQMIKAATSNVPRQPENKLMAMSVDVSIRFILVDHFRSVG